MNIERIDWRIMQKAMKEISAMRAACADNPQFYERWAYRITSDEYDAVLREVEAQVGESDLTLDRLLNVVLTMRTEFAPPCELTGYGASG